MNPCLTDIELLREIFLEENRAYWRLLAGRTTSGAKLAENFEVEDIESSCELLMRRIEQYGNGTFNVITFEVGKAATANARGVQHPLKIGGDISGNANHSNNTFGGQLQHYIQFYEFMNNNAGGDSEAMIAGVVENIHKDIEIKDLKRQIAELKRPTTREKVLDKLVDKLPLIAERVFPGQGIAGTLGYSEEQEVDDEQDQDNQEERNYSLDDNFNLDMDIDEELRKLGFSFGVFEMKQRVLKFMKEKSEQAKMVLNQL